MVECKKISRFVSSGRLASYELAGTNSTFHEHTFRARFFDPKAGKKTIAQFTSEFLAGTMQQIVP